MIRRWSCINTFNFHINPSFFFLRFIVLKLLKAVNFKKYSIKFTKFKRHKLSRWKRQKNWLIYVQIMKYWVWDYNFYKKLVKSQFLDSIFLNSFLIYHFNYTKKKNPITDSNNFFFLINSLPKRFSFYFDNKFFNYNYFSNMLFFKNTNYLISHDFEYTTNISNFNQFLPISFKFENFFFHKNQINRKNIKFLNFFFYNDTIFNYINHIYKIFIFNLYMYSVKR